MGLFPKNQQTVNVRNAQDLIDLLMELDHPESVDVSVPGFQSIDLVAQGPDRIVFCSPNETLEQFEQIIDPPDWTGK